MYAVYSDAYENGLRVRHVHRAAEGLDEAKRYAKDAAAYLGYPLNIRKVADEAEARSLEIDPVRASRERRLTEQDENYEHRLYESEQEMSV